MTGPEEFRQPLEPQNDSPPVHLLIKPTVEMFGMMEDWKLPEIQQIESGEPWTEPRTLVEDLIKFCDLVINGSELVEPSEAGWIDKSEAPAIRAWQYARGMLDIKPEQVEEFARSARRGLRFLVGQEEKMEPGDSDKARKLVKALEKQTPTKT